MLTAYVNNNGGQPVLVLKTWPNRRGEVNFLAMLKKAIKDHAISSVEIGGGKDMLELRMQTQYAAAKEM